MKSLTHGHVVGSPEENPAPGTSGGR